MSFDIFRSQKIVTLFHEAHRRVKVKITLSIMKHSKCSNRVEQTSVSVFQMSQLTSLLVIARIIVTLNS